MCSACLLGIKCRYDGGGKTHPRATPELTQLMRAGLVVPVCPEQLGGLTTPRAPAGVAGGDGGDVLDGKARVLTVDGEDVTSSFLRGAHEVLRIARMAGCRDAVLKSRSPSCGRLGVTAALLEREGISIRDEESFSQ